jgi:single-strand DNA-binding protein
VAEDTLITFAGTLAEDPVLRFTPAGMAVANFTIASTPKMRDRVTGDFRDGETLNLRCSVWRDQAENLVESLHKGARVIATGLLKSRTFETRDGEKKSVVELDVVEIGASLRFTGLRLTDDGGAGGTSIGRKDSEGSEGRVGPPV